MIRDDSLTGNGRLRPAARRTPADPSMALPRYELRAHYFGAADTEMEVWQLPSPATPALTAPVRVAGLRGRNLELVEHRVTRRLKQAGVPFEQPALRLPRAWALPEELALTLGLLFRALAPMRSRDNLRNVVEGIELMGKEEAAYWLGMAMHRKNPRRVLSALCVLLTAPKPRPAYAAADVVSDQRPADDTRLIERWLPIAELGEESVRERRSMTALPPTYYLHVWWARRPLVASRAAILASLLPADADRAKFKHLLASTATR